MKVKQMLKTIVSVLFISSAVQADILYDWNFATQSDGTKLGAVTSTGTESSIQFYSSAFADAAVSSGNLIINQSGANQICYANISDPTSGTYWYVAEVSGWTTSTSLGYTDLWFMNGTSALSGMRLSLSNTSNAYLQMYHSGGLGNAAALNPTGSDLIMATKFDIDSGTATVLYKLGDNDWVTWVDKTPNAGNITHLRFSAGNFGTGNEIQMSRVYLTDTDPTAVPEPATIGLFGVAGALALVLRRIRS